MDHLDPNLVGPKIEKLNQSWLLMVPYPVKKIRIWLHKEFYPIVRARYLQFLNGFAQFCASSLFLRMGWKPFWRNNFYVHAPLFSRDICETIIKVVFLDIKLCLFTVNIQYYMERTDYFPTYLFSNDMMQSSNLQ